MSAPHAETIMRWIIFVGGIAAGVVIKEPSKRAARLLWDRLWPQSAERQLIIDLDPESPHPDEGHVQIPDHLYWTIAYRGPGVFRLGAIRFELRMGGTIRLQNWLPQKELEDGESTYVWTELAGRVRSSVAAVTVSDQSGRSWTKRFPL